MAYKSEISKANRTEEAKHFPEVVLIDNCSACNLRCSMCDHHNVKKYRTIQHMDIHLYEKIIDEIAIENPQARVWEIFFGDPFLCRDIIDRIAYAKDKGLTDVVLNSNGVLMTEEKSKRLIQAGLDSMYVGVDASTEETYDQIRVGGNFYGTIKNVLRYRDLLAQYGGDKQNLYVQFVVSDINEHEQEDFKTFWKKEGIGIKIRPKVSWAGLVDASNLQDNDKITRKPCYWLMRTINICADGEVALCSIDVHCRVKCGNMADHTIKELWQGKLKGYRTMHKEERFRDLPQMCQSCSDWQSGYAEFA